MGGINTGFLHIEMFSTSFNISKIIDYIYYNQTLYLTTSIENELTKPPKSTPTVTC